MSEHVVPILEPRTDGRPHIDRDVTDTFENATIGVGEMTFESRQVRKSIVTGEVKGEATFSAAFSFTAPPQEFFDIDGEQARVPFDISGTLSTTRSGNTDRGIIFSEVRFSIGHSEDNFLNQTFAVTEEEPVLSETYEYRSIGIRRENDTVRTTRIVAHIKFCDGCVIVWTYAETLLDGTPEPTEPEPTSASSQPTATPTPITAGQQPSSSDAALDDLISTFGRLTQEVAEERIRDEIPDRLEELASWLGGQMEAFLEASEGFLNDVYDSLPDFAWEEEDSKNAIPDDVDKEPDDPGGPGISSEKLIDLLSNQVKIPLNVEVESGEELFDLVSSMLWSEDPDSGRFSRTRASGGEVIELTRTDGTKVQAGVFVTPDGRVLYSTDGTFYYPELKDAIDPSLSTRGVETYQAMRSHVWQRLFEGSLRDKERQLINDVSQEVLDEFRREMSSSSASSAPESAFGDVKDPFKDVKGIGGDPYAAIEGKATKSASDYLEGQIWGPVTDTLKKGRDAVLWAAAEAALDNSVEFEARQNLKFILKEYKDLGNDAVTAWEDMKKKAGVDLFELTGIGKKAAASGEFMVAAVQQMGKGLQDSDFGVRAREYIAVREQGLTPKQVWTEVREGRIATLEFSPGRVTRSGLESVLAQQGIQSEVHLGISFSLYEQAYQRFVLAQKLGRSG